MRIFLTGATGYLGSAVLDALLRGGHQVTALVRDREKAERLPRPGVQPVIGDLSKPASYTAAAEGADGVIHAAFEHSKSGDKVDRQAIDTLLAAARRRTDSGERPFDDAQGRPFDDAQGRPFDDAQGRPFDDAQGRPFVIYTSGVWVLGKTTKPAAEDAPLNATPLVAWRPAHEKAVLDAGADGRMRTAVIRPGIVYGGSRGIISDLLKDAANGLVRVVGNGRNHWPCIYDRDLADVYLRVATHPDASGVYHANDEGDERVSEIVEAIAGHVKMRPDVRHMPIEEARAKMGPYADALALDQKVRSPRARALGWAPTLRSVAGNVARLLEEFRAAREGA